MRRNLVYHARSAAVFAFLAAAACAGKVPIEEARQTAVAQVGDVTLDGATLERLLMQSPREPTSLTASMMVSSFIDAALMRQLITTSRDLTDSTLVASAIRPDAIRGVIVEFFRSRAAEMPPVTDEQADSLGRLGSVRVFQHILVRLPSDPAGDSAGVMAAVQHARRVSAIADTTTNFSALAREFSDDTATASRGGWLPAVTQRELPQGPFAEGAWGLDAGAVSRIAPSQAGGHIIRRGTQAESREALKAWLAPRLAARSDSLWVDSLMSARQVSIAEDHIDRVRELAVEPLTGGGDAPYATWEGGEVDASETRMWVSMLPAIERAMLQIAPDSAITLFISELAERDIVATIALGEGAPTPPRAWDALAPQFSQVMQAIVDSYREPLGGADGNASVRSFLERAVSGELPYRPLPGALGAALRSEQTITLDQDAIDAIILHVIPEWRRSASDSNAVAGNETVPAGVPTAPQ